MFLSGRRTVLLLREAIHEARNEVRQLISPKAGVILHSVRMMMHTICPPDSVQAGM